MYPNIPGRIIAVVKKQAATPRKSAPPNCPKAGKAENIRDPNANIVVSEVSRMAFPVLENTSRIFPGPSCLQRCRM